MHGRRSPEILGGLAVTVADAPPLRILGWHMSLHAPANGACPRDAPLGRHAARAHRTPRGTRSIPGPCWHTGRGRARGKQAPPPLTAARNPGIRLPCLHVGANPGVMPFTNTAGVRRVDRGRSRGQSAWPSSGCRGWSAPRPPTRSGPNPRPAPRGPAAAVRVSTRPRIPGSGAAFAGGSCSRFGPKAQRHRRRSATYTH